VAVFSIAYPMVRAAAQEVVDRATTANAPKNKVVATITVGSGPNVIVVSPNSDFVYVVNQNDNTISAIDASNRAVVGSYSAGSNPAGLAITPDGKELYVTNFITNGTVTILNAATGALIKTVTGVGNHPKLLAISPDGKQAYVPDQDSGTVSVIDTATQAVTSSISIGTSAISVVFSPKGKAAYVCDSTDNAVFVIDTTTLKVVDKISTTDPLWCAVNPKGKRDVYVRNYSAETISVVQNKKVIKIIQEPQYPEKFAVTKNGKYLYVPFFMNGSAPGDTVVMISTTSYKTIGEPITVGNEPSCVTIAADQKYAYVSNQEDGTVSVIDIQQ